MKFFRIFNSILILLLIIPASQTTEAGATETKNSWRGITPLRSSSADVSRVLGVEHDPADGSLLGPVKVDGGEVSFTYLTTSLAKIYRAPKLMVGKVFTIYFKPSQPVPRSEMKLSRSFKQCNEEYQKFYYYFVSDTGVAYQMRRASDSVEAIIFQPSRAEISRLAVITECVF